MLSKYDIDEMVAQSAESVVFAGVERDGGGPMQLRRYLTRVGGKRRDGDVERFGAELGKVRGLEAPHLVGILEADFDAQDDNPHFVTRTPEGASLLAMLDGALLAEEDAARLADEALDALDWLHRRGLVHGGLRADRLYWSRHHGVWLTDVGMEPALVQLGDFASLGDEATTAPELRGRAGRTAAGDLYALGATIYQLLTGMPAPAEPGGWPGVGEGKRARWDGWIAALCAADPDARPADCAAARELLHKARASEAGVAEPAGTGGAGAPAPLLVRVAAPAVPSMPSMPVVLGAGERKPALSISGQTPVVALPSAKSRSSAAWVAALVLLAGVGAGGYFLTHRDKLDALAARFAGESELAGAAPVAALDPANQQRQAQAHGPAHGAEAGQLAPPVVQPTPDESIAVAQQPAPAVDAQVPAAPPVVAAAPVVAVQPADQEPPPAKERSPQPEPVAKEFYTPRDNALILAQQGKLGSIRGIVQKVGPSQSGVYLDVIFHGGDSMAFLRVAPGTIIDITKLQEFKGKEVQIRGTLDIRPWGRRERPSVRFSSLDDISLVPR